MLLGRVVGTLVASRKDEGLEGQTFLVVRQVNVDGRDVKGYVVAVDTVVATIHYEGLDPRAKFKSSPPPAAGERFDSAPGRWAYYMGGHRKGWGTC